MFEANIAPFEPVSRAKHRALLDPWFQIDSVKQSCLYESDLPVDSRIAFSNQLAEIVTVHYQNFAHKDN
jgi:hypothetical protein